jgi:hydroxyacylglutathione hydrolase
VGILFFNAGVGNCKNGGDPTVLFETIKNIFNPLDDKVKIYPSHDYFVTNLKFAKTVDPTNVKIDEYLSHYEQKASKGEFLITTMGEEKLYNPFFRALTKKFQSLNNKEAKELFIELRTKRDRW